MDTLSQEEAVRRTALGKGETARFWREPRYGGLECLSALFRTHVYERHTHETYVIGTIVAGCEQFDIEGVHYAAGPDDLCFVNPDAVHDGRPLGEGYAYRMIYPSIDFIADLARDLTGRAPKGTLSFASPIVHDPEFSREFIALHRAMEGTEAALVHRSKRRLQSEFGKIDAKQKASAHAHERSECVSALAIDEAMVGLLGRILTRHARLLVEDKPVRERGAVNRAKDYLAANVTENVDLITLAAHSGLSRAHLIRAFKRDTGLTPHAFLIDRRVRLARQLLLGGEAPVDVAAASGFADQAHMTRAFKARIGTTPGSFARMT